MPINFKVFFSFISPLLLSAFAGQDNNSFSNSAVETCGIPCLYSCFLSSQGEKTTAMDMDIPQFTQYCVRWHIDISSGGITLHSDT